jgi:hypothetical protein
MLTRPLFAKSIDDLSKASERNWSNLAELLLIVQELHHRDSRAAMALKRRIGLRWDELASEEGAQRPASKTLAAQQFSKDSISHEVWAEVPSDVAAIQVDVAEKIGFVSQQNAVPPLRGIVIVNEAAEPLKKMTLTLETDPGFLAPRSWQIDHIAAGETLHILDQRVDISASYTKGLSESERGTVTLRQYHAEVARLSVAYVVDSEQTVDHGRLGTIQCRPKGASTPSVHIPLDEYAISRPLQGHMSYSPTNDPQRSERSTNCDH